MKNVSYFCKSEENLQKSNMRERIKRVFELTGLSQQDFAKRLGISAPTLSSLFSGRTQPNARQVEAIHRGFPEINVNWLMFGEGEMLVEGATGELIGGTDESGARSAAKVAKESQNPRSTMREALPAFGRENVLFGGGNRLDGAFAADGRETNSTINAGRGGQVGSREAARKAFGAEESGEFVDRAHFRPRQIKEIRVFFDDGTYEVFSVERK